MRSFFLSALLFFCLVASAQTDTIAHLQEGDGNNLNEAVVLQSRDLRSFRTSPIPLIRITHDELQSAGINSLNDVLKLVSTIDVRQRGGFGEQADISIEGSTFDQIAIFVNGISIQNPQTGHNTADFAVNLSDIDYIEIHKSIAPHISSVQGLFGTINIVTKTHDSPHNPMLSVQMDGGSYGLFRNETRSTRSFGPYTYTFSRSMQRGDGPVRNSDFKTHRLFSTHHLDMRHFMLDAQISALWNKFGANTFYSPSYPNQWEGTKRFAIALKAESKGRVHICPLFSWARNIDHFQLVRGTDTGENFHRGNILTGGFRAWTDWQIGRTCIFTELRHENIQSTNLGIPLDEEHFIPIRHYDNLFYTHKDHRNIFSLSLTHEVSWKNFDFSASLATDKCSAISMPLRFYPGASLTWRVNADWRWFVAVNRTMRLPTFTDLYYYSPTNIGNRELRPEENTNIRLGTEFAHPWWRLQVEMFFHRSLHLIDWVMFSADDLFHATDFNLDNMGAMLSSVWYFKPVFGESQPLRRLSLSYTYIHQHKHSKINFFKSNYAQEYLRHKLVMQLDHRIIKRLEASWTFRIQQREGSFLEYINGVATGAIHPYGTHALLDLRVSWKDKWMDLYADFQNLTCTRYFDIGNVPQARFTFLAGAQIRLNDFRFIKRIISRKQ
ncbi:MAG: TonB-dependent receptor [Alloprevotella sp.]|nr:TonB-dependent receptor [Alloprevotella sp.]